MSSVHFWHGKRENEVEINLDINALSKSPLDQFVLYGALTQMRNCLMSDQNFYNELLLSLMERPDLSQEEAKLEMKGLIDFIEIGELRKKVKREFQTEHPFELKRVDGRSNAFESYYPLGTIVHFTPSNAPLLCVLSVIEGLLSGNVNILKLGRKDGAFAAIFFEKLCALDRFNLIADYVFITKVNSKETNKITELLSLADAVSVWGSEESVAAIKALTPKGVRVIEWGHKISFSYFSKNKSIDIVEINKLAHEICQNDQMACSSPQCVYIENASFLELETFGEKLFGELKLVSTLYKKATPSIHEDAELTVTSEVVRLKSIQGETKLLISEDKSFRIYIENNSVLAPSPLFRTIWLKPLMKKDIVKELRPLSQYLQTVGLACHQSEVDELSKTFFKAGLLRVRPVGEMLSSYAGEPHDGELALLRFTKKINFHENENIMMKDKFSFNSNVELVESVKRPIMEKSDFQNQKVEDRYSDLFFYSGGSSGDPKLSVFTYDDYHRQMQIAAEGLFSAGLDPKKDRTMNLFYAGSLYGGFTSFFTILEKLNAVQFPMGASTDFEMVGKTIVNNKVDTLLGMPSYLIELFKHNSELFKKHKVIKKIFFGGEHFAQGQRDYLIKEFDLTFIRSASYGSVDAGPLGHQCAYSEGRVYHLYDKLLNLEFVDLESDEEVQKGEIGRMLFTSKVRHGQQIERYAIGDIGKEIAGTCQCLSTAKRFELLGRYGDIFRIGTVFLSYEKFQKILLDEFDFYGQLQIHLHPQVGGEKELIELKVLDSHIDESTLHYRLLEKYSDLNLVVNIDNVLNFKVVKTENKDDLIFNAKTGKLKSVIDHRI